MTKRSTSDFRSAALAASAFASLTVACSTGDSAAHTSNPQDGSGGVGVSGAPSSGDTVGSGGASVGGNGPSVTGGTGGAASGGANAGSGGAAGAPATGGAVSSGGSGVGGALNPDVLEPAAGALLGQFYGSGTIAETTTKLGRTPAVHLTYYAWADDWTRNNTKTDLDAGRIPLVNWEPSDPTLDDIIGGTYDAMLQTRAADAQKLGKRFFLDWGAEMNGDWSPWSGANNGSSADKYVAAYRHIHDALVGGGATNIIWLWCPNVTDEPRTTWNQALNYYPGDGYVDWTCVDGYNWGSSNGGGWQTFQDVFKDVYPKLATKGKPIMIGEMASAEVGGNKAQFIDGIIPSLKSDFPSIKGLVWFDINKETDWRISSSPESEQAFVRMANDPYFNP